MDIIDKAIRSSIPLRKVNPQKKPIDIASGCFLIYKGLSFFLTVRHIYENRDIGDWNILIGCEINNTTGKINAKMQYLPPLCEMNRFLLFENPSPKVFEHLQLENSEETLPSLGAKRVDFVYRKMDFVPCHIELFTGLEFCSIPLISLEDDLESLPDKNKRYIFFGNTKPYEDAEKLDFVDGIDVPIHRVTPSLFPDIKYIKKTRGMLEFELSENRESEEIAGCSGAPIIDEDGNLVSLVVEMDHKYESILNNGRYKGKRLCTKLYGVDLQLFKTALDREAGVIG